MLDTSTMFDKENEMIFHVQSGISVSLNSSSQTIIYNIKAHK